MANSPSPQSDGTMSDQSFYTILAFIGAGFGTKLLWPYVLRIQSFYFDHPRECMWAGRILIIELIAVVIGIFWNECIKRRAKSAVLEKDSTSIYLGKEVKTNQDINLKQEFRTSHTQVIGSTNAGKTASYILPAAIQDMEQGRGMLILDGKADQSFLNKMYSYAVRYNRQNDFKVFSLANPAISSTYNPFCEGSPEQIAERFFSTLNITDPYYASIQFSALRTILELLIKRGEKPMPGVIRELLRNKETLSQWLMGLEDRNLRQDISALLEDSEDEFLKKYSGLVTALGHFSKGSSAPLYNTRFPEIDILEAIKRKQIIYFQLPTMQFPFLGEATGKLVLQSLQSAVSEIQVGGRVPESLFSVYLDDFNDYIYPGFASLLNKSRSANVGVVFSHQSLGDLEKVSPDFKQIVVTNTNIKVIMRSNDPESAEHFAKLIGTQTSEKATHRRSRTLLGAQDTGEQSVRETEEYKFHPNVIKSELKRGEGIVVIPHPNGTEVKRVKFATVPDLPILSLPIRDLPIPDLFLEASFRGTGAVEFKTVPTELELGKLNSKAKRPLSGKTVPSVSVI